MGLPGAARSATLWAPVQPGAPPSCSASSLITATVYPARLTLLSVFQALQPKLFTNRVSSQDSAALCPHASPRVSGYRCSSQLCESGFLWFKGQVRAGAV